MANNPDTSPSVSQFSQELATLSSIFLSVSGDHNYGSESHALDDVMGAITMSEQSVVGAEGKLAVPPEQWDSAAGSLAADVIVRIKTIAGNQANQRRDLVNKSKESLASLPLWGG